MQQILVVDDDPDILDALQCVLEDAGYSVITCKDGGHAEELAADEANLPKLIILDVLLSGRDGREICRRLKTNERTKRIPIVMISAQPSAQKSVLASGANTFIPKPFDITNLLTAVSSQISLS